MPIISISIIKNPRKTRRCNDCGKYLYGETIKLYGMAEIGDKPYNLFAHRACLHSKDALEKLSELESKQRFMAGAKLGLLNS